MSEPAIPEEWIKSYVDKLLHLAGVLAPGTMRDACLLRADHAMDMVKAWRAWNVLESAADKGTAP